MVRRLFPCLLPCLIAASAQTTPADQNPPPDSRPFFSRVRGLFDIDLPELDPPGTVKLILHPHLSDFIRRDYLRTEAGFRWALNDRFELSAEASTYLTHGLGGGSDGYGIGELRLGAKYIFTGWLRPAYEASVTFNASRPTGTPPLDMTDGFNHFLPGFTIQRHSERNPKLTTFAAGGLDLLGRSTSPGTLRPNEPHDDSFSLTAGAVYDLGQFKWTFAGTYASTALLGDETEHFFYLKPSLLWYVPARYTFHSKTQWIVGLGLRSTWGPDGYDFGVSTRVRAEITFRQVVANVRERVMPRRAP
ncbi:MAG: hypothetical protein HYX71_00025 [Opitutae bacterium]|nr:hypothetical protein [Opitutae bacterium]